MDFSEVMQNLVIGIIGGVFSGVIVSIVFYILNEYEKELATAKEMIYELQYIVSFWGVYEQVKKNAADSSQGSIAKDINANKKAKDKNSFAKKSQKCFVKAVDKFEKFEPWRFKFEIKEILNNVYDILIMGRYCFKEWDNEILSEVGPKIKEELDKLTECEKHFARGFLKRIFLNKIIITMGIVLAALIVMA